MQHVSPGMLISENVRALQEVLWDTTRQFASNPNYKQKMTLLLVTSDFQLTS